MFTVSVPANGLNLKTVPDAAMFCVKLSNVEPKIDVEVVDKLSFVVDERPAKINKNFKTLKRKVLTLIFVKGIFQKKHKEILKTN